MKVGQLRKKVGFHENALVAILVQQIGTATVLLCRGSSHFRHAGCKAEVEPQNLDSMFFVDPIHYRVQR